MNQLSKEALLVLAQLLEACEAGDGTVLAARFRADHPDHFDLLDQLVRHQYIQTDCESYRVGVTALPQLDVPAAKQVLERAERLWAGLRNHYKRHLVAQTTVLDLAKTCDMNIGAAQHTLRYMLDVPWYGGFSGGVDKPLESIAASEKVLKHTSFLSVIEEVLSWNSIGTPSSDMPSQATFSLTEPPSASERSVPALPDWLTKLPTEAQALMREVHAALAAELHALSAMGMRAVVDVVCHDKLGGDVGGFAAKMKALREAGYLNQVQHAALLAVVDAGHAAAHRGYVPAPTDARAMLGALDHLLQSLYVLTDVASELGRVTPKRPASVRSAVAVATNGSSTVD